MVVVTLVACKSKLDRYLDEQETWRDKVCACKKVAGDPAARAACTDEAKRGYDDWSGRIEKELPKDPPEEKAARYRKADEAIEACNDSILAEVHGVAVQRSLDEVRRLKSLMCGCKDDACKRALDAANDKWHKDRIAEHRPLSPEEQRLSLDLAVCAGGN